MNSELDKLLMEVQELNIEASDNSYNILPRVDGDLSQVMGVPGITYRFYPPGQKKPVLATPSEYEELINANEPIELLDQQTNCSSIIEKSHKYISDKLTARAFKQVSSSWKRDVIDTYAAPTDNAIDFNVEMKSNTFTRDVDAEQHRLIVQPYTKHMLPVELEFAKVIQRYNEQTIRGEKSSGKLFSMLREVVKQIPDSGQKEIWLLVEFICQLPVDLNTMDCNNNSYYRCKDEIIMAIIKRATKFLEIRYKSFMKDVVSDNLEFAQRGDDPCILSLILAFINVRLRSGYPTMTDNEKYDNRPLWPTVYYCLRVGDFKAALHVLSSVSGDQFVDLKAFIDYKIRSEVADCHVDPAYVKIVQKRLVKEHDQMRNSSDIYKRAVYTVLVGTKPDPHLDGIVFLTINDELWYKLCIVIEQGTLTNANENSFSLNQIQKVIFEKCGEGNLEPQVYCELLMLTGQFEAVIEYLWRTDLLQRPNVVHLAIALNEINLLRVTKSIQGPVLQNKRMSKSIVSWLNLALLVLTYTHPWEANQSLYAMHYFYLLRHIFNADNVSLWFSEITRLVNSNTTWFQQFKIDLVFGKLNFKSMSNVVFRSDGFIDNFGMEATELTTLMNYVGQQLEDNCLFEYAITVYNLARNDQKVLTLSCQLLNHILSADSSSTSLEDAMAVYNLAIREQTVSTSSDHLLYKALSRNSMNIESVCVRYRFLKRCRDFLARQYPLPAPNSGTNATQVLYGFNMLLKYADALELFAVNRLDQAFEFIHEMGVLPISIDDVEVKVNAVMTLHVCFRHMLPDVILLALKILHNLSKIIESHMDKIKYTNLLKCYKCRITGIMRFAAMLPIAVSNGFRSDLIRLVREILAYETSPN